MARFDLYQMASGDYVVDCQADLLSELKTRLVVPLASDGEGAPTIPRLNPTIEFEGERLVFYADLATAVPLRELGRRVGSLADHDYEIMAALDMLITGF